MPNHTSNLITVKGNKKDVSYFLKSVLSKAADPSEEDNPFDLEAMIPVPQPLYDVGGVPDLRLDDTVEKLQERLKTETDPLEIKTIEKKLLMIDNLSNYGYESWYQFCIDKWGTKWNTYDHGEWNKSGSDTDYTAFLYYQTAWSPPSEAIQKGSEQFPGLLFINAAADEGGGFLLKQVFSEGELVDEINYDWDSTEGVELREELGCYYEDEDEYDYEDNEDEESQHEDTILVAPEIPIPLDEHIYDEIDEIFDNHIVID